MTLAGVLGSLGLLGVTFYQTAPNLLIGIVLGVLVARIRWRKGRG